MSATAYAFGAGVFYFGYALFEVPSNLILGGLALAAAIMLMMLLQRHRIAEPPC